MTDPHHNPPDPLRARWQRSKPLLLAIAVVFGLIAIWSAVRSFNPFSGLAKARAGETTVSQAVIVGKMRTVAQLVTTETTVRDVVVYENRRLGFSKRALVVVTARVLAGIDLDHGTDVKIDQGERKVRIELPAARVLSVEVTEMRTYDERSGLFNPFRPADRDSIFAIARRQIVASATETGALEHANRSAQRLLETLVSADGYTTEVILRDSIRATVSDEERGSR